MIARHVHAAALVWHPGALDSLEKAAELMDVDRLDMISIWLDFVENNPEVVRA